MITNKWDDPLAGFVNKPSDDATPIEDEKLLQMLKETLVTDQEFFEAWTDGYTRVQDKVFIPSILGGAASTPKGEYISARASLSGEQLQESIDRYKDPGDQHEYANDWVPKPTFKSLIHPNTEKYNLSPMRYPWAYDKWVEVRQNFWMPHQIAMGRDKGVFDLILTDDERETFLDVFATLTTADLVIQENLALRIYEATDVPEIRLFMGHQSGDESLHSVSYQHIVEILGLNDGDVYRRYLHKPEIGQKFELANKYGEWIKSSDPITRYLGMVFFYGGFEGIWFYHGFTPIFSLQRRNLMVGTGEQLQYIGRDEVSHYQFGIKLLNEMATQIGRHRIAEANVHAIFKSLIDSEITYATACIRPMVGYNAGGHIEQAKWLCNIRLQQLGWSPLFEGVQCTVPWLDEQFCLKKEKNFFETHVNEYQTGVSLNWEDGK